MRDPMDMHDLEQMADEARLGSAEDMKAALTRGISLYEADDDGNVFEVTPEDRRYAVTLHDDRLVRVREVNAA
jgi:hypothetical protein